MPAENRAPSVGQWNPGQDWILEGLSTLQWREQAFLRLNAAVTSELWLLGFSFPLKLLGISEASHFLFFPFQGSFPSSDVFRCLDVSFSGFGKKICPYALEIAIGLPVCPEIPKNSSRSCSYSEDKFFIQQDPLIGDMVLFFRAVWFSLLADVSGGRLLFIIMKSIAVWCQRPLSLWWEIIHLSCHLGYGGPV